jgi:hypothetical protein
MKDSYGRVFSEGAFRLQDKPIPEAMERAKEILLAPCHCFGNVSSTDAYSLKAHIVNTVVLAKRPLRNILNYWVVATQGRPFS